MAENKELARLEVRVFDSDKYTGYETQVNGSGKAISHGLAKLINQVADDVGVPSGFLLVFLTLLCEGLRKGDGSVSIDMGAVERAMGKDEGSDG